MLKSKIYFEVEDYCRGLLTEKLSKALCFHNLSHTEMVVNAAYEISQEMRLRADDVEIVVIAAWFHDTGFIRAYNGHEEESCSIAARFLLQNKYDLSKTERILKYK
ncbi:MAG: HD domain-containing protein [Fulvivirga sp.]